MPSELDQLQAAIVALEAQRALLGDAAVEASVTGLRARLAELSAAPEQSLRQVTILFLDVVGSTTLSQHLDPEEIHAVMDGALERCTAIVKAHHGKVLQYAGDSLLAVFGADIAREDDAESAVRCGLALLDEGRRLGEQVRQRHGHAGFNLRLGVHTGGVLLGGGVDAESSIRGIAVNIAARMEQTAPAGAMRISHHTYRLVSGLFDVESQDPIVVKGVDEPIVTYLALRAKPRTIRTAGRGIEGIGTRMIGRDAELALLQRAFKQLFTQRSFELVAVVADTGLGKSRLLHEFESWASAQAETPRFFRGRANPQTQSEPYGLLRDILVWWLKIGDGDSVQSAQRKVEAGIAPLFEDTDGAEMGEAHAHLLGHLIGIDFSDSRHIAGIKDDARQIRNRAFHAAARMWRRAASTARGCAPAVLLLEDLHWADDGTLDFLQHLAQVNHDVPMLVLAVTRPTLFERRSDLGVGTHQRIHLKPLDHDASRLLAGELLHKLQPVPDELSELIAGRAQGNPFYMEELVKMLVDQGAISTTCNAWTLHPGKLQASQVPPTLTGVLQARLDALPKPERLVLQEASVIGLVFWDRALAALDEQAPVALPALVQRALALPRLDAALDDMHEYVFSHQILHQVTYATLLKRTKRELHARVAAWLSGLTGAQASALMGAAAEHYAQAGDSGQASLFFTRAAEHAKARFAHDLALEHVARGLSLLQQPAGTSSEPHDVLALRWRLLFVREYALAQQGKRAEQRIALDELQQAADALDDDRLRALAARRRSMLGLRTVDHSMQEGAARQAMALAERAGDLESKLEAQRLLADALGAKGDHAAGEALARAGLAEARARGLRRVEGIFLNALSFIAEQQDDQVTGLELDQQDLPIWRELGDRHGESVALGNVGADWLWFGELARARPLLEDALKLARAIGARVMECGPLGNLSQLTLWEGDAAQSLALAHAGLEVALAIEAKDFEARTLLRVGEAELALGHHAAAAEAFERAEVAGREVASALEHDAVAGRAQVALAQDDVAVALALVEVLLARRDVSGGLEGADMRSLLFICHCVLARAGDARATDLLADAHDALQKRAATISDATLRDSFMNNVPIHRSVMAAWEAAQGRVPGST